MIDLLENKERQAWHDKALWQIRQKRDKAAGQLPEWENLRGLAEQIKAHTISRLPHYLEEFEKNAQALGVTVHWAPEAKDLREIVGGILEDNKVKKIVKSKSMLTEECGLNHYLEDKGMEVVDTDLGERIVQLAKEPPSHIVMPAIHKKREEIGQLFHQHMGSPADLSDPKKLTETARQSLRKDFLSAEASITGVNFAIAETGGVVVCTNEGNADLGCSLTNLHIACMGIEKLIPRKKDLSVFLRLLARSATGQPITAFTSHFHGPRKGGQMHIVIVDNGRHRLLAEKDFRKSLSCIRCGACMNTCPVYRRSGGHSYNATIPGPIGSILSPNQDLEKHKSLPFKSSLCGSCTDVCPVKIDLHEQLLKWRKVIVERSGAPGTPAWVLSLAAAVLKRPALFSFSGKLARISLRILPRFLIYHGLNPWGKQREMPEAPAESFKEQFNKGRRR